MRDHKKCGGSVLREFEAGSELRFVFAIEEAAAVDEDKKIGRALIVELVVLGECAGRAIPSDVACEVCACGEAEDADALGVDAPFDGVVPENADGPLSVFDGHGVHFFFVARGGPVLEQRSGYAHGVEPFTHLGPFGEPGEEHEAAAGGDEHGGSVGCFRAVQREGWLKHIGHAVGSGGAV